MPTTIDCPKGTRKLTVPDHFAGGRAKCLGCNSQLEVDRWSDGTCGVRVLPQTTIAIPNSVAPPVSPPRPPVVETTSRPPEDRRRRPPFLTRTGAVIECPDCLVHWRIERHEFNRPFQCEECLNWLEVIVPEDGGIPVDCAFCDYLIVAPYMAAGQKMRCPDCRQWTEVPRKPLLIRRIRRPRVESSRIATVSGGRRCSICSRSIRNPLPLCYKCQRMLGI